MAKAKSEEHTIKSNIFLKSATLKKSESSLLVEDLPDGAGTVTIETTINLRIPSDEGEITSFGVLVSVHVTGFPKKEGEAEPDAIFSILSEYVGNFAAANGPIKVSELLENLKPYMDQVYPLVVQHCKDLAMRMNVKNFKIPLALPTTLEEIK